MWPEKKNNKIYKYNTYNRYGFIDRLWVEIELKWICRNTV